MILSQLNRAKANRCTLSHIKSGGFPLSLTIKPGRFARRYARNRQFQPNRMSDFSQRLRQLQAGLNTGRQRTAQAIRDGIYRLTSAIVGQERLDDFLDRYRQSRYYLLWHRLWKTSVYTLLALGIYVFVLETNFLWLTGAMPTVEELRNPKLNQSSEMYSQDGKLIGKFYTENRTPIKFENIPKHVIDALVATEDARFYKHGGIDVQALGGVLVSAIRRNDRGGGSTITQQLAKNLFKTRRDSRGLLTGLPVLHTIIAKSKEWLMALTLERNFSKNEIITYYFNTVDFGANSFGLKTAARTYFRKLPDNLTIQEGAVLVGLQKATTSYNPLRNPKNSLKRRNVVLDQMAKYGYLTKPKADSISKLPLRTHFTPENPYSGPASYLKMAVQQEVEKWGQANGIDLYTAGLKIILTVDSRMQRYAEEAMQEQMKKLQRTFGNHWRDRNPWTDENGDEIPNFIDSVALRTDRYKSLVRRFPNQPDSVNYYFKVKKYKMEVFSWNDDGADSVLMTPYDSIAYYKRFLQAGLLAMDPHNGYIKAWVGGLNYDYFKYDHVKQGKRQPGSTFKPFVYVTAIDDTTTNMSPCDRIQDRPFSKDYRENGEDKVWSPRNSTGSFTWQRMTLRRAMARSVNSITAQLTDQVGPELVAKYAHKLGIRSRLEAVPSIGLGSSDVSLYELVDAYCSFANDGVQTDPLLVQRIEDRNGEVIETFTPKTVRAISSESAFLMRYMLLGGLQEPGGTSQNLWSFDLFKSKLEIGGKTGTTSNNSDGWFVGVSDGLVVGAWVGGDDRSIHFRSTDLGEGAKTALPIVGRFLEKVYADRAFKDLQRPFPKPGIEVTKEYMNCTYGDGQGRAYEPDSLGVNGSSGDSLLSPTPTPVIEPIPTDTTRGNGK